MLSIEARELYVYATNSGDLYRQRHLPIIRNLCRHLARGGYDSGKAVRAFQYLADDAARAYVVEFCLPGQSRWNEMFDGPCRLACAVALRDAFESEYDCNQHDGINPVPADRRPARIARKAA